MRYRTSRRYRKKRSPPIAAGRRTYEEYQSYRDRFHSCDSALWPVEYTRNITAGTGFLLGGVLAAWLGIRRRKGARKEYEDDVRRYTGTTMMKVVWIEDSVVERWEHQEDGSDRLRRETYYLPTYEYTVNGTTYRYSSRQSLSGKRDLGRQVVGYYDPAKPECITENRPRKPVFGGAYCFLWTAFLLFFGIMTFTGQVAFS